MKIGIIIGRIGGVDGVALETEKWIEVLKRMGHKIYIICGQFENRKINLEVETIVPEMSFFSAQNVWEQKKAFFNPEDKLNGLLQGIEDHSDIIYNRILKWISKNEIEVIISENASALPAHLSMGMAIKRIVEHTGLPTITHDHDFAWERGERYKSIHEKVNKIIEDIFPLRISNVQNAVINEHARAALYSKFNSNAVVVPNVMNFDAPFAELTEKNKCFRQDLDLSHDAIILAQVTRIVRRKGIEVAIQLVNELDDKNINLIITGNHSDDEGSMYYNELIDLIHDLNLGSQIRFVSHKVANNVISNGNGKHYSLSDVYANTNSCTYFSTYEGFGNAFVEAVVSKTPIFVNNYKPVYWPDIGSKGFKAVMLEDNKLTEESITEMQDIIYNPKLNREIADFNYELGNKYFSYETLQNKLEQMLEWVRKL